jgi:endonuclease/exonuclease/phosphatase family metal-dependent hydrolase
VYVDVAVGTFNLNNLFDRFNFEAEITSLPAKDRQVRTTYRWELAGADVDAAVSTTPVIRLQRSTDGKLIKPKSDEAQAAIAGRIDHMDVDVLCVQEVENLDALRRFNRTVLPRPYPFEVLIEGNDPRFIDVGLLSRLPLANLTSHRFEIHEESPGRPIFGRDLLEVDVLTASRSRRLFRLYVNHLKSHFVPFGVDDQDVEAARNDTKRRRQAETVARVVAARTHVRGRYVVVGDMNDAPDSAPLEPMITRLSLVDGLADVVESSPAPASRNPEDAPVSARWTHRYPVTNAPDRFELFDQIWLSPSLAPKLDHAEIERRVAWTATARDVGSDHDPAWVRLRGL